LVSARAGYQAIEFQAAPEDRVQATYAFIDSLEPEPSPYLGPDGQLTPDAVEGKKLFEGAAGCSGCHSGAYFTDMLKHDVGTRRSGTDGPDNNPTWDTAGWDTPTLIEAWRTAPYLHLGTAVTVKDVMTTENKKKMHGNAADMTSQQIDQLAAYVMQIGPTRQGSVSVPDAGGAPDSALTDSSPTTSDGSGGASTSQSASGGSGGALSPHASGGSGGRTTSATSSGGSGGSQGQPSSCVCSLGARGTSGRGLPVVVATLFLAIVVLGGPRRWA
jgi:mono/diheme cytochrome c family protein